MNDAHMGLETESATRDALSQQPRDHSLHFVGR
jgi:hypothetical protein